MPIYKLTSELFTDCLFFEYESGQLAKFANYSEMGDMQLTYLSAHFPVFEEMLPALKGKTATIKVVQQTTDFESFNKFMSKK